MIILHFVNNPTPKMQMTALLQSDKLHYKTNMKPENASLEFWSIVIIAITTCTLIFNFLGNN